MARCRRWLAIAAVALAALGAAGCGAPYSEPLTTHAHLNAIAMLSPTEGWIVGDGGAMLHYHGGRWVRVAAPSGADLNGVAMVSPGEGWAVGLDNAQGQGVILHDIGGAWALVPGVTSPALRAVAMVSPGEGWAVGDGGTILHDRGGHWSAVASPTTASLTSLAMLSASEGWAGGSITYNTQVGSAHTAVILHLSHGVWTVEPVQAAPGEVLGVAMTSASTGWAVGRADQTPHELLLSYAEGRWTAVPPSFPAALLSVIAVSGDEDWSVGEGGAILYLGRGLWTPVRGPVGFDLSAIAMPAPGDGWAVGDAGAILRDQAGTWSVYRVPAAR